MTVAGQPVIVAQGLGLLFWLVDAALLCFGARSFRRSELAAGM
jgi:hypothetical protein